jgi:thiol-disulfide isomerase/thioredoxin
MSMAALRGKVILLDITAIGCAACVLSVPPLNKLHEKYKGTDVAIVSINLSDTRDAIVKFREKNHVDYPVCVNGKTIKLAYHISAIPTFYVINKQGIISEAYDGFFENFEQEVSSKIEGLR